MAIINVKGGIITSSESDGWNCTIRKGGDIVCEAVDQLYDGKVSWRYVLQPNGFARLTRKTEGAPVEELHKGYVIPKGRKLSNVEGIIILGDGKEEERFAYFEDANLFNFKAEFKLDSVRWSDPNRRRYHIRRAHHACGYAHGDVFTNGILDEVAFDDGFSQEWADEGSSSWEEDRYYKVSGASWCLIHQDTYEGTQFDGSSRILYTQVQDLGILRRLLLSNPEIALSLLDWRKLKSNWDLEILKLEIFKAAPYLKQFERPKDWNLSETSSVIVRVNSWTTAAEITLRQEGRKDFVLAKGLLPVQHD